MSGTSDPFFFRCNYCGREWNARGMGTQARAWSQTGSGKKVGANTGFVAAAAAAHEMGCKNRTPAERRLENERAERRWAKSRPVASVIRNNWQHAGLKDGLATLTKEDRSNG